MWWLGERDYLDGALFVHALTNEEAEAISAYGVAARTVVAPNGIDADLLPQATRPDALFALAPELAGCRVLAFMGRLAVVQKGLDVLVRGMALANLPDVRLVLLGPDWRHGRAEVQRLVDRLGLHSRVRFFDAESSQRCADLMAGVDVFVHTSRWEGMALAILEAAVWQKPCLLTRAADPGGTLGRAGGAVIVEPTPESVADGILRLCSLSRAELRAMGCRARSTVSSRFRWTLTASTLARAYGESLAKP
jgi:glycosyltransferase involved in cell wall biosynthesis